MSRGFPPRGRIWYPGGATLGTASLSTSMAIAKPSTVVDNTLLLAVMAASANVAFSVASTGFQTDRGAGTLGGFAVWYKFVPSAAGEAASSYTFTAGIANLRGFIFPVLGCDPSQPVEEIVRGAAASGTPVSPSVDPDQTGLTLVALLQMIVSAASQAVPAGMGGGFLDLTAGAVRGAALETLSSDAVTGTRTWGQAGNHGPASVLLRPHA